MYIYIVSFVCKVTARLVKSEKKTVDILKYLLILNVKPKISINICTHPQRKYSSLQSVTLNSVYFIDLIWYLK